MFDWITALLVSVCWIFVLLLMTIGVDQGAKQKDRMMKICIEKGASYDDCLNAWNGK